MKEDSLEEILEKGEGEITNYLEEILEKRPQEAGLEELLFKYPIKLGDYSSIYNYAKLDEVIREYKRVFTINPENAKTHYNLGLAMMRVGRLADAVVEYEKTLAIDPDYKFAQESLSIAMKARGH